MSADDETQPASRPTLRVIRGDASAEEIAALLAVVSARTGATARSAPEPVSAWTDRSALTRRPVRSGPGAWTASGRPQ